ncbi:MAG: hypothetical protein WBQ04_04850 [Candidatus Acidiferrales bacterium]
MRWTKAAPRNRTGKRRSLRNNVSYSSDTFVLQNTHYDPSILRLSFRRLVVADLMALSHRTWGQHPREGNVSLLNQNIGNSIGAVFAELLV